MAMEARESGGAAALVLLFLPGRPWRRGGRPWHRSAFFASPAGASSLVAVPLLSSLSGSSMELESIEVEAGMVV
jgi:hypothetical protein